MSALPTMQGITLSDDQLSALECVESQLSNGDEAVLVGPAGTGKTTIMRQFLSSQSSPVRLMAPTGKASLRLSQTTGREARTVHSYLYGCVEEVATRNKDGTEATQLVFGNPHPPVKPGGLAVVDEASMIGSELYAEFMKQLRSVDGRVLWVGDKAQLEPVGDTWGPDLDAPTAELTQVHRQALESPVLELATLTRLGRAQEFSRWGAEVAYEMQTPIEQAMRWAAEEHDRVVLTWTNRVRHSANATARKVRGFSQPLVAGDKLLVRKNNWNLGVVNGEVLEVEQVAAPGPVDNAYLSQAMQNPRAVATTCGRSFYVDAARLGQLTPEQTAAARRRYARSHLPQRIADFVVQAEYGYCLTTHASQGSQWSGVRFLVCPSLTRSRDDSSKQRLMYTAITRASEQFIYHVL